MMMASLAFSASQLQLRPYAWCDLNQNDKPRLLFPFFLLEIGALNEFLKTVSLVDSKQTSKSIDQT